MIRLRFDWASKPDDTELSMAENAAKALSADDLLHGHCHLLAVALHRFSRLPIMAYVEPDFETEEATVLIHAFVADGDEVIDARGRSSLKDVLDGFDYWAEDLVEMTEAEVLEIGGAISGEGLDLDPGFMQALVLAETLLEGSAPRP